MIITKLSVENFRDVSCGSFQAVAFLLPHNSKDRRGAEDRKSSGLCAGMQPNQEELISCFGRDGIFKD